jgi:hypothetical protein
MKFHFFRLCILIPLQSIIAFINCTESLSQPILLETNPELTQKSNNLKVFTSHFGSLLSNNSEVNPFALMEEKSLGQLKIGMAATLLFYFILLSFSEVHKSAILKIVRLVPRFYLGTLHFRFYLNVRCQEINARQMPEAPKPH